MSLETPGIAKSFRANKRGPQPIASGLSNIKDSQGRLQVDLIPPTMEGLNLSEVYPCLLSLFPIWQAVSLLRLALDIRQGDQQVWASTTSANALVTAVVELLVAIVIALRPFGRAICRHRASHHLTTYEIVTRCLVFVSLVLLIYLYLYVVITVKWPPADEQNTDMNYILSMYLLNFLSIIVTFEPISGGSFKDQLSRALPTLFVTLMLKFYHSRTSYVFLFGMVIPVFLAIMPSPWRSVVPSM